MKKNENEISGAIYVIAPEMLNQLNAKLDAIHSSILSKIPVEKTLKKWLTEKEAQKELGKGTTAMWALRKSGKIKSAKIGGKTFYDVESIEHYLSSTAL